MAKLLTLTNKMKKIEYFLLAVIILGAFLVRLYKFERPVADWHSWRQVDTSSVSRNFIKYGFDVLHPKFDDLSKGVSLIDNPKGYRFVEFPIYNLAQAGLFKFIGHFTIEEWGRLITIFSQLISIVFLYLIVKKYLGVRAGVIASAFFAFIPYNIYFGRTLLPDSSMVTALLGGTYFFDLWMENYENKKKNLVFFSLSLIFMMAAFLLKPYAIFFSLPIIYLAINKFGIRFLKKWKLWLFLILSLLPFVLWRLWMQQFPEGIPQSSWLYNGSNIRFKGAFFQWLFADRISQLILGFFGLPFFILGILTRAKKEKLFFYLFIISSLLFMFVIATGNVQHDYYQILIIPTIAIFFAKGLNFVIERSGDIFNRYVSAIVILVCLLAMFAFSWYKVRNYYDLQHVAVLNAGAAADRFLPKNAKVVAPYGGDTTLLYYVNRMGWPVFDRPLTEFIKDGAGYMVFANPQGPELNFTKYFPVVDKGKDFIIFDLTHPLPAGEQLLKSNQ